MSGLDHRLSEVNINEPYLPTGREAFATKKYSNLDTFWVDNIPVDRHRFSHWAGYLNDFSSQVSGLAVESCENDCKRQMSYVHGKNVSGSDDLLMKCKSRCKINTTYTDHFYMTLLNKNSNEFGKCLTDSKNNQITYEDLLECKKKIYIRYMDSHLEHEKNNLLAYLDRL